MCLFAEESEKLSEHLKTSVSVRNLLTFSEGRISFHRLFPEQTVIDISMIVYGTIGNRQA